MFEGFFRLRSVACFSPILFLLIAVPLSAQTLDNHSHTNPRDNQSLKALIPFGTGFATKALAKELLESNNIEYISHFACSGAACEAEAPPSKLGRQDNEITQFELTGFHKKLGVLTIVIFDVPCQPKRAPNGLALENTNPKRAGCFAGYQVGSRIFLDTGHGNTVDGWLTKYRYRLQAPSTKTAANSVSPKPWTDLGSYEFVNESEGRASISGGMWQRWSVAVFDAEGTQLAIRSESMFTVPVSSGKPAPTLPRFPNLVSTRTSGQTIKSSEPATVNQAELNGSESKHGKPIGIDLTQEEIDRCDKVAKEMSNVATYMSDFVANVSELGENLASTISPTSVGVNLGSSDQDAGHSASVAATYANSPGKLSSTVRRMNADAESMRASLLFLGCSGADILGDAMSLALEQLLEDGEGEEELDLGDSFGELGGGKSCENWATEESIEVNEVVCTLMKSNACDAECNCDYAETIICPEETIIGSP